MTDRGGWRSKGDKVVRRSPIKRGKKCGRPFVAPRQVRQTSSNRKKRVATKETEDSDVQLVTDSEVQQIRRQAETITNSSSSKVQIITDTQNEREILATRQTEPATIAEKVQETTRSDTTKSTPEIFRSPVTETNEAMTEKVSLDLVGQHLFQASNQLGNQMMFNGMPYRGVTFVPETEVQDAGSDSDDNIPVVTLLRKEKGTTLSLQQINDCKEGPKGEKAIGVSVAKLFEGVEFRGIVDSFRTARQRLYYHVTYSDGDEEEMSQAELRDGYVLGLAEEIQTQWETMKQGEKTKAIEDTDVSEVETSDGEGSEYDRAEYNEEMKNKKRKRKENKTSSTKKKYEFVWVCTTFGGRKNRCCRGI
jgi:hypothetical protein